VHRSCPISPCTQSSESFHLLKTVFFNKEYQIAHLSLKNWESQLILLQFVCVVIIRACLFSLIIAPSKVKLLSVKEKSYICSHIHFKSVVVVFISPPSSCRYNQILVEGLPDWRQPLYYYRRVHKMGLFEMSVLVLWATTCMAGLPTS